jgi:hypothetical protein
VKFYLDFSSVKRIVEKYFHLLIGIIILHDDSFFLGRPMVLMEKFLTEIKIGSFSLIEASIHIDISQNEDWVIFYRIWRSSPTWSSSEGQVRG